MAWANKRIVYFCVIFVAVFRYSWGQLSPLRSCQNHSNCELDEKCCTGKCRRNCSFVCSSHEHCTLGEYCCGFDVNFTRICAVSCIGKSCESYHDCGADEICCIQNSGKRQCVKSCTIGKWCTSHLSCGSGEFCCLNKTEGRQCSESCTVDKPCVTDEDCLASENGKCCDNKRCKAECKTKGGSQHIWYVASGTLLCVLLFVLVFCIVYRTRKEREARASGNTAYGEAIHPVTRGTIDLENQLQHCAEQNPSVTQCSNPNPNYPPTYHNHHLPPYTNQPMPFNQFTAPTPNLPPPPYPDQPPPPYQA